MRGTIKWKRPANGTVGRRGRSSGHFASGFGPRLIVDTIGLSSMPVANGSHGGAGEQIVSSRRFVRSVVGSCTFGRIHKSRGLGNGRRTPKGSGTGAEHCPGRRGEAAGSSAKPVRVRQASVEESSDRRGQGDAFSAHGRVAPR